MPPAELMREPARVPVLPKRATGTVKDLVELTHRRGTYSAYLRTWVRHLQGHIRDTARIKGS